MRRLALAAALALVAGPALAHTGHSEGGFIDGLSHPIFGLDHVLAMVAVGLWAAQLHLSNAKALWSLPVAFMTAMAIGAGVSLAGIGIPLVEAGITGSIVVLGLAVAIGRQLPTTVAMAVVGAFALFHGHAHGTEMPELAAPTLYGLGFLIATGALHLVGVFGGLAATRLSGIVLRTAGGLVALTGLALFAA
ncbi:HupE/UreJ family protein [Lacibacterium aquatile]|uniref:HupE/UreJ family protein n=1 Tax=Lacibacterium aquatile TaxID=1168082 RepID=A0ABW5DVI2_9PROT